MLRNVSLWPFPSDEFFFRCTTDTSSDSQYSRQRSVPPARSKTSSTVSSSKNSHHAVDFAKPSLLAPCPFRKWCSKTRNSTPIRFGSFLIFGKQKGTAKCPTCRGEDTSDVKNILDEERAQKQWNAEIDRYEKTVEVPGATGRIRNPDQKSRPPTIVRSKRQSGPSRFGKKEKKETQNEIIQGRRGGPTKGSTTLAAKTYRKRRRRQRMLHFITGVGVVCWNDSTKGTCKCGLWLQVLRHVRQSEVASWHLHHDFRLFCSTLHVKLNQTLLWLRQDHSTFSCRKKV